MSKENDKEGLTVLIGYSANGSLAPPMIVYSYKQNIPCGVIESVGSVDPSWALGSEAFLGLLKAAPYLITLLSNVVLQSIFHALRNNEIQGVANTPTIYVARDQPHWRLYQKSA